MKLIEMKKAGPKALGMHPEEGAPIYVKVGPFGPYLQMGEDKKPEDDDKEFKKPKRVSIPKHIDPDDISLDLAINFLGLPRRIGHHPEDNKVVNAGIGRFGPYVQHAGRYKSLDKEDDVLTIDMDRAVELIKQIKGRQAATPLKELGKFPDTDTDVAIYEGKYGPYIKSGKNKRHRPQRPRPQRRDARRSCQNDHRESRKDQQKNTPAKPKKLLRRKRPRRKQLRKRPQKRKLPKRRQLRKKQPRRPPPPTQKTNRRARRRQGG